MRIKPSCAQYTNAADRIDRIVRQARWRRSRCSCACSSPRSTTERAGAQHGATRRAQHGPFWRAAYGHATRSGRAYKLDTRASRATATRGFHAYGCGTCREAKRTAVALRYRCRLQPIAALPYGLHIVHGCRMLRWMVHPGLAGPGLCTPHRERLRLRRLPRRVREHRAPHRRADLGVRRLLPAGTSQLKTPGVASQEHDVATQEH